MIFVRVCFILVITFPVFSHAFQCVDLFSVVSVKVESSDGLIYRAIQHSAKENGFKPQELFPDYNPTDIYLGFTAGHVYVSAGGHRYDGGMALNGHIAKIRKGNWLSPGIIVRITNVPEPIFESLVERMVNKRKPVSVTCSAGSCSLLRKSGIDTTILGSFVPSQLFSHIAKNGIRLRSGGKVSIDFTVVNVSNIERSIVYNHIGQAAVFLAPYATLGAIFGILSGVNLSLIHI